MRHKRSQLQSHQARCHRYVIAYDVRADRTRRRVAERLGDVGVRVGLSVFEVDLGEQRYERLLLELSGMVDSRTDRILGYRLCASCKARSQRIGKPIQQESQLVLVA